MSRETRAMQDDDAANPGMLWVLDGETLWRRPEGPDGKSCADCHGDAGISMSGIAARYPASHEGKFDKLIFHRCFSRASMAWRGSVLVQG